MNSYFSECTRKERSEVVIHFLFNSEVLPSLHRVNQDLLEKPIIARGDEVSLFGGVFEALEAAEDLGEGLSRVGLLSEKLLHQSLPGNACHQSNASDSILGPIKVSTSLIENEKSEIHALAAMEQLGMEDEGSSFDQIVAKVPRAKVLMPHVPNASKGGHNRKVGSYHMQNGSPTFPHMPRAILSSPENDERLRSNRHKITPKKVLENKKSSPGSVSSPTSGNNLRRYKVTYVQDPAVVASGKVQVNCPVNRATPHEFRSSIT